MRLRANLIISSSTFLGALAALLATLPLYVHFPIIPYLRFEAAEIPIVFAFLILGPEPAVLSSIIYWIVLLLVGEFTPIGPTMKFIAVFTMLLGLWLGFRTRRSPKVSLFIGSCLGCLFRVLAMSIFNYVIVVIMFPEFIGIAAASISAVLGTGFLSYVPVLAAVLVFTAIFNVLHVIISITPAYLLVRYIVRIKGGGLPIIGKAWYVEVVRAASRRSPQRS